MTTTAIIVNKNWEVEPVLAAMCSAEFRPAALPFPEVLIPLQNKDYTAEIPRAIFRFHEEGDIKKPVTLGVKIWCVQDLMRRENLKGKKISSSSSKEKYKKLKAMLDDEGPDLVVAVGTAGYLSPTSYAGCVVAGARFFVHNGHPDNEESNMNHPHFDELLPMNVNLKVMDIFNPVFKQKLEGRLMKPPINPSARPCVIASQFLTAISSVNVTDYGEYAWVDRVAIERFRNKEKEYPVGSMETTHGVIRLSSDQPCIYLSAITDSEGDFDLEVTPAQNYICSFNAGIVLGQFLVDLNAKLKDPEFRIIPEKQ